MRERTTHGTTTITLSIPVEGRDFFNKLAEDGYNRSFLMLGMTEVLQNLYRIHDRHPGGLPETIKTLKKATARPDFFEKLAG